MKSDLHPNYQPVIFEDMVTGKRYLNASTMRSDRTEEVDGVTYQVVSCGITADSHPFFTGKKSFIDTEGRIDKFAKRFGSVRRAGKPKLKA